MIEASVIIDAAKNISAVVGCATGVSALCVTIVRPLRRRFVSFVKKETNANEHDNSIRSMDGKLDEIVKSVDAISDKLDRVSKGTKANLADSIKSIYFTYYKEKKIPYRAKESLIMLHDAYKALYGNHGVDEMYDEAMTWEVI